MRIIAGKHRGRTLRVGPAQTLRPSSDRLRQAVFNILDHGSHGAPYLGEPVIDLFAGTGAWGLEALSRGAAFATFVDHDPGALLGIRQNAAALGESRATNLLRLDATRLIAPPHAATLPAALAFLDPPYGSGLAAAALQGLCHHQWLQPDALLVVEVARKEPMTPPKAYAMLEERVYGTGRAVFLRLKSEG